LSTPQPTQPSQPTVSPGARLLSMLLIGLAIWWAIGAFVHHAEDTSYHQLDQYYTDAQSCNINSPSYLNCLNDKAHNDLKY